MGEGDTNCSTIRFVTIGAVVIIVGFVIFVVVATLHYGGQAKNHRQHYHAEHHRHHAARPQWDVVRRVVVDEVPVVEAPPPVVRVRPAPAPVEDDLSYVVPLGYRFRTEAPPPTPEPTTTRAPTTTTTTTQAPTTTTTTRPTTTTTRPPPPPPPPVTTRAALVDPVTTATRRRRTASTAAPTTRTAAPVPTTTTTRRPVPVTTRATTRAAVVVNVPTLPRLPAVSVTLPPVARPTVVIQTARPAVTLPWFGDLLQSDPALVDSADCSVGYRRWPVGFVKRPPRNAADDSQYLCVLNNTVPDETWGFGGFYQQCDDNPGAERVNPLTNAFRCLDGFNATIAFRVVGGGTARSSRTGCTQRICFKQIANGPFGGFYQSITVKPNAVNTVVNPVTRTTACPTGYETIQFGRVQAPEDGNVLANQFYCLRRDLSRFN